VLVIIVIAGTADITGVTIKSCGWVASTYTKLGSSCRHSERLQSDVSVSKAVQKSVWKLHCSSWGRPCSVWS